MRYKIMYTIIVFILSLVMSMGVNAQINQVGSWVISAGERPYYDDSYGYINYQLDFKRNGISNATEPTILNMETENMWDFVFSLGTYNCDNQMETYITDNYLYFDDNQDIWESNNNGNLRFQTQAQMIKSPWDDFDYLMFYSVGEAEGGSNGSHHTALHYNTIKMNEGIPTINDFDLYITPQGDYPHSFSTQIISNTVDDEKHLFALLGHHNTSNPDYYTGDLGLQRFLIDDTEIDHDGVLLIDEAENDFPPSAYIGYNIEMQNKNEVVNPIIAWITNPSNTNDNDTLYIYDGNASPKQHFLDFSINNPDGLIETGSIGGIEFSPYLGEEDYMYMSCEEMGLIKINWRTGELVEQIYSNDFNHSYVQTAPDANIYVVSNDGTSFGMVSKIGTHDFDPIAFQYPFYVGPNGVTEDRLMHINYKRYPDGGEIKYYTLPENDFELLNATPVIQHVECDNEEGEVTIYAYGGVAPYTIQVTFNGDDISSSFIYDETFHTFTATNLEDGLYFYEVTDSDIIPCTWQNQFAILDIDPYTYEENMYIIDQTTIQNDPTLADLVWDMDDEFPNNTIMFKYGFVLTSGVTLTINDLNLEFDQQRDAKVIIEPGAKLIINNSIFTKYHCVECGKWDGVEVWGNYDENQAANNGNYIQGYMELNSSLIDHAETAVYLGRHQFYEWNGGILKAENSSFENNAIGVYFPEYHNRKSFGSGGGIIELDNISYIKYCNFHNNENYIEDADFDSHIKLRSVKGIKIKHSIFNSGGRNGIGIDAFDAGFSVSGNCDNGMGCTPEQWEYSTFTAYERGIYTRNATGPLYSINIDHTKFFNNQYGVFANNLHHVTNIRNCFFHIGKNTASKEKELCAKAFGRGIHISNSNNFHIEYNRFEPAEGLSASDDIMGIVAMDNPSNHDIIYNNTFTSLKIANEAYGDNREDGNDMYGIEYQCNDNTNNRIDFEVIGIETNMGKIHPNMGYINLSAHNKFTSTSFDDLEWHWRNMGMEQENYYLYPAELGSDYEPHNDKIETTNNSNTLFTKQVAINENQCPDNDGIHKERTVLSPEEKQDLETEYAQGYNDYQAVETIFNDLKDGGSTTGTSLTIATAQPSDTWELRGKLLAKSPHLSKLVLMEAADKTDVLPNSVLLDILASNPDELKKQDFIQYLENKEEPLPNYMINILRDLAAGTTYKTVLLNQMALHKRKKVLAANQIINSLLNEEEQDLAAIKNWLSNLNSLKGDMQIATVLINEENYNDATNLLYILPDIYNLQGDDLSKYLNDKDLLLLKIDLKESNRSYVDLTDTEIAQLELWADDEKGFARTASRNILETFYAYDEYCDCIDRNTNKSANASDSFNDEESPLSIEASPNPAIHYVEFTYQLSEVDKEGVIIITDINGKQIRSFSIKYSKGVQAWDTRNIPVGTYLFTLKTKYFEESGKLIIQ